MADPPLPRPDYLASLPERQWAFAEKLWEERRPCTPQLCEAGYRGGALLVSVVRGLNYFQAVAGVKGCATVSEERVRADHPARATAQRRLAIVSKLAVGVAAAVRSACEVRAHPRRRRGCGRCDRGGAVKAMLATKTADGKARWAVQCTVTV
ncbi:MAG: hypothetical protein JO013_05290 [Alphaproteobacteria bacterium]|nr:hypothetical protein [Alphaproteobacteria bacterium]